MHLNLSTNVELGEGDLVFKESRHPCLEVQDAVSFIPNDVEMSRGDRTATAAQQSANEVTIRIERVQHHHWTEVSRRESDVGQVLSSL